MPFDFTGKKILVTGAGRAIGREVAKALDKSGCRVYALSRTKSNLDSLVEEHPGIFSIVCDVSNWEDTREKLEQLEVLDGLVNNAGIQGHDHSAIDTPKDYMYKVLDTNLLGALNCSQVIAKRMIEEKVKGSIVNVSSVASLGSSPRSLSYNVSKAALDMVSKAFSLELGPHGIRVNSINPCVVMTPMVEEMIKLGFNPEEVVTERTPMGRLLQLREIVDPILYLLSDHSSMVTGQLHVVDGGLSSSLLLKT